MQPTRPIALLTVAAVSAALAWLISRSTFASLPPLPWTAVPALALLAIGEYLTGRNLRSRLHPPPRGQSAARPAPKPVQPMAVPRIVALAKSSSMAAAVFGGLAFGFGSYALAMLDKPTPQHDAIAAGVTVLAAVALLMAALYLERSCRAPDPPEPPVPSANGQRQAQP